MNSKHHKTMLPIAIGAAFLLAAVAACFQVSSDEVPTAEPCVPLAGSDVDPCERYGEWSVETEYSASYRLENLPTMPFTFLGEIRTLTSVGNGAYTPQFYVRGTFVPGSSRCGRELAFIGVDNDGKGLIVRDLANPKRFFSFQCYIDIRAHEYLNGDGPDRVPIRIYRTHVSRGNLTDDYAAKIASGSPMRFLEGREMVLALTRPNNIAIGAWGFGGYPNMWDVQRRDDGEVVVVSGWAHIDYRFDYEFTLDEFRAGIKEAMATIKEENGGRVGSSPGERPYAEDANLGSLLENLRLYGAYSVADITPVAAPLVPGETDPDPYGLLAKAH